MNGKLTDLLKICGPLHTEKGVLSYQNGRISLTVERNCQVPVSEQEAEHLLQAENRFVA